MTKIQRTLWICLLLLASFTIFGSVSDLIADARTGLPTDHAGTFTALTGADWTTARRTDGGVTGYVTLLERGYALHELVFGILFVVILAIPFRRRQRWAWWAAWAPMIADVGYALTFGADDRTIGVRSLIVAIALPVLLLALAPAFFPRRPSPGLP